METAGHRKLHNSRFVKKHLPAYHKEKGVFYARSSFYPALNLFTSCRYRQNTGRYRKSCTGPCHILQHLCRRCSRTGRGLSSSRSEYPGASGFFGMHIHENGNCTPPFNQSGSHYNPTSQQHPFHDGDLPPLLSNRGYAWTAFYDTRFGISDIVDIPAYFCY